jgi:hypothetical protein
MRVPRRSIAILALIFALTGCAGRSRPAATASASPAASTTATATTSPSATVSATPNQPEEFVTTYNWAVPTATAPGQIKHAVNVPPVPVLVSADGIHYPDKSFVRIVCQFKVAIPGYTFRYVPGIVAEGNQNPIAVPGTKFFSITFKPAQAHDGGADTHPPAWGVIRQVGAGNVVAFTLSGDYEGYVSLGFGLKKQVEVRLSELTQTGPNGDWVAVAIDVRD